jgi:hypothetical protein
MLASRWIVQRDRLARRRNELIQRRRRKAAPSCFQSALTRCVRSFAAFFFTVAILGPVAAPAAHATSCSGQQFQEDPYAQGNLCSGAFLGQALGPYPILANPVGLYGPLIPSPLAGSLPFAPVVIPGKISASGNTPSGDPSNANGGLLNAAVGSSPGTGSLATASTAVQGSMPMAAYAMSPVPSGAQPATVPASLQTGASASVVFAAPRSSVPNACSAFAFPAGPFGGPTPFGPAFAPTSVCSGQQALSVDAPAESSTSGLATDASCLSGAQLLALQASGTVIGGTSALNGLTDSVGAMLLSTSAGSLIDASVLPQFVQTYLPAVLHDPGQGLQQAMSSEEFFSGGQPNPPGIASDASQLAATIASEVLGVSVDPSVVPQVLAQDLQNGANLERIIGDLLFAAPTSPGLMPAGASFDGSTAVCSTIG